jgi:hypothetical protein
MVLLLSITSQYSSKLVAPSHVRFDIKNPSRKTRKVELIKGRGKVDRHLVVGHYHHRYMYIVDPITELLSVFVW